MTDVAILLMDLGGGGAEKVMLHLAEGFSNKGHSVDLVLVKEEGPYLKNIPPKVRVIKLQSSRLLFCIPKLIKYLRQERPLTMLTALEDTNLVGLWARQISGVKTRIILSIHTHISWGTQHSTQFKDKLTPFFSWVFYRWADNIVAVSQGVAEDLAQLSGLPLEKINVIYNPIVTPKFWQQSQEPTHHPWLSSDQACRLPVILGVGRLEHQKDFSTLIRAFAKVQQHCPAKLMILGEGSLRTSLQALAQELGVSDRVALIGFVDNPYAYMAQASVFVLSSVFEGFGNVLGEAMAAGTPVVSTDCKSGPSEILEGGKYGKLVPVGDVDEMAEAIISTLKHPIRSEILRQRGSEFSQDRAVPEYLKVLKIAE
jgi:glycosyltransferase involved in cell wall biosynthesis